MQLRGLSALLGVFLGVVHVNAQITLSSLLVENQAEPLGIDVSPRFSWQLGSSVRSVTQTCYRLTLSASAPGGSEVWDSGVVPSSNPYLAPYAGPPLSSDQQYFWTVSVVSSAGSASAQSTFTTGFLASSDWGTSVWIGKNTTLVPQALVDAFTSASWIWTASPGQTPPNAPTGDIALRLTYAVPSGLTAVNATILATADDLFTLYANGVVVGSAPNVVDIWRNAQIFADVPLTAASESSSLVFAIRATNAGAQANPAGVLFAALVLLSDNSSVLLTSSTSSSWKATTSIPADFQLPSTSDESWDAPISLGTYGVSPWATSVVVAPRTTPVPSLSTASWIWNDPDAAASTAAGDVLFRRTFPLTSKTPVSAQIVITADNLFVLWVNGVQVGAAPNDPNGWQVAETIPVSLAAGAQNVVFAVQATNQDIGPAGLLLSALVLYSDGSSDALVSDADWKTLQPGAVIPDNWQSPNFDDASWNAANVLGKYGVAPWENQVGVPDPLGEHPAPLLRKGFVLDGASGGKEIAQARVIYAAGGYAAITLNGQRISDRVLTPGFTKYDTRMQYVVVDVKGLLAGGSAPNVLAAELGRSHYGVTQGSVWNWAGAPWHGEPVLRLVLSVVYTDGTRERIVSDGSWKNVEGPTRLDDLFGGENYDASYEIPGWNLPTFDDSAWNTALVAVAPKGTLVHAIQPPTRLIASLTPVNITQPVAGQFVAAFERVVAGWVKLRVTGAKGSLVTIHYGEKLNPDGTVIYQDLSHLFANNFQTDRYWLAGTGTAEVFEPKFSYKGYQYIQISGWPGSSPPTPADIIGQVVHDDLAPAGDFACSVDLLNQLHIASVRTMLNNVHSIPTDCPTFEKNGWSGDAQLSTEMLLMNFDSQGLLNKYVQDLQDSLPAGGNGPPAVLVPDAGGNGNDQAPPWHAALILIPAWLYSYRGDLRALSDNYAGMKSYIEFELGRSPNNIANTIFGDWLAPDAPNGNPAEDTRVPATAYLYHMLDVMSTVATTLGNTADAATFAAQAASVKHSFNNAFFNASLGHYAGTGDADYRQSHNLLALAFNLTTDAVHAQTVADSVVADVNGARGGHLNTGALSTKHILPMLTQYGYPDVALAVAQQTTYPSWGFWIENGGTSLWEGWWVDARSHDHMFLGTFEDWFYKSVLGIQATSTAFKTVSIAPLFTSSIPSASGWLLTPFGNLTVSYTTTGAALALDVTLPIGVSAVVSFARAAASLSEGGKPVAQEKGVTVVSSSGNAPMQVQVGSGKYSFMAN
ncbi:bacterial alpha-L-rhamnosidase-domain-containing protein [Mycena amicta]|nr:bacterial alpha-L-rhamnosidase-domain-containing protein [Mycena amicta]